MHAFLDVYRLSGYESCSGWTMEDGYEKIALYADSSGLPTHAARQLPGGRWTSKLGRHVDIEHADRYALQGSDYGSPVFFMRRPRPT
jgi:hypothetical protein